MRAINHEDGKVDGGIENLLRDQFRLLEQFS